MKNTKERILDTARNLFNELGYSNVTIRMIAQQLEMSSGNLNYHFKKREDILEALYFEMVTPFDERVEALPSIDISLVHVKNEIETSMARMNDYRFFWTDIHFILQQNNNISAHFKKVYSDRLNGYLFLFKTMNNKGLMQELNNNNQAEHIAKNMLNSSNTWIYNQSIYSNKIDVQDAAKELLLILFPYLTQKGINALLEIYPEIKVL